MDPVGFAASIIALIGVLSETIKYLSAVKDASTERGAITQEAASLLPILVSLQNKVENSERLDSCSEGLKSLATEYGPLDQLRAALQQLVKKVKPGRKGIANLKDTLTWPLDKKQCEDILKKVERVKSRISLALQGDIYEVVHEIKSDTAGIDVIKGNASRLIDWGNVKERSQILTWFSPLNFFQSQQDKIRKREKDTGQWLIDLPDFQTWILGADSILCLLGNPGVGKSILASIVVDHLRNVFVSTTSYSVAAAYCNFKERGVQSPENLLAGLCLQVIEDQAPVPDILTRLYGLHTSKRTRPTLDEILDVFKEAVKQSEVTYIIVDALDECSSEVRDVLLQKLKSLQPMIRLLITARPTIDHIVESVTIDIHAIRSDLEKYILSRIANSSRLSGLIQGRPSLARDVCDKVIEKASGM